MSFAHPHGERNQVFSHDNREAPSSSLNFLPAGTQPAAPVSAIKQVFAARLIANATLLATAAVFLIRLLSDFVWSMELIVLLGLTVLATLLGRALTTSTLFRRSSPPLGRQKSEITAIDFPALVFMAFAITLTDYPIVSLILLFVALATARRIARSLFDFTVLHLANQPSFHPETSQKWMDAAHRIGRRKLRLPTFRPAESLSRAERKLHHRAIRTLNRVRWFRLKFAIILLIAAFSAQTTGSSHNLIFNLQLTVYLAAALLAIGLIRNARWLSSPIILVRTFCRWLAYVDLPDSAPSFLARVNSIAINRKLLVVFFIFALVASLQPLACYFPATLINADTTKWEEIEPKLITSSELPLDDAFAGAPWGWFPYCCFGILKGDSYFFFTLLLSGLLSILVPVLFAILILWAYIGPALAAANAVLSGDSHESGFQPSATRTVR